MYPRSLQNIITVVVLLCYVALILSISSYKQKCVSKINGICPENYDYVRFTKFGLYNLTQLGNEICFLRNYDFNADDIIFCNDLKNNTLLQDYGYDIANKINGQKFKLLPHLLILLAVKILVNLHVFTDNNKPKILAISLLFIVAIIHIYLLCVRISNILKINLLFVTIRSYYIEQFINIIMLSFGMLRLLKFNDIAINGVIFLLYIFI